MRLTILFLAWSVLLLPLWADEFGLIRVGQPWRYLKVVEPSVQVEGWQNPALDDRNWSVAQGGFSSAGRYGETTVLTDYGTGYNSILFRKEFSLATPEGVADLILRIDYDDGFVAYLNGVEVVRRQINGTPGSLVQGGTLAEYHPRGYTEEISLTNALPLLREGTNLLAVQLLGSSSTDRTFCFVAELLANYTRSPYIQNTTQNSTQIIWKTLASSSSFIEFGEDLESAGRMDIGTEQTNHIATLTGLLPNTTYFYRTGGELNGRPVLSDWNSFKTFKPSGEITFQVIGDSGWASAAQFELARQMQANPADLVMHVGDMVYYAFSHYASDLRALSVYADQLRTTPLFLALGNHEMYIDPAAALETFYLPTNTVTGTEHFYSFDHGDVHFAVAWSDVAVGADYKPGSAQYNWLDRDLARSAKPWKFIFFHHTWRTSSAHWGDDYDYNSISDSQQLDEGLGALARKHGVQFVFNGHDHTYERFAPSGGTVSFVSGGGGAVPYWFAQKHPDSVQFHPRYHFMRVRVNRDRAVAEAVGTNGVVFDTLHLHRNAPATRLHHAAWHTPQIASVPGTEDGNIPRQQFDFAGEPINGLIGARTSSGRLFVNNDATHLYIGLDEVMLHAGEELFLFIEAGHQTGISSMTGLGNGVIDPDGEGADGLDFLENVAFENFRPSVGVILGDEFADGPFRSFQRAEQPVNTGQGAFYLAEELPQLPGQRIQQFNRSPESGAVLHEQNSDFIEIAIPFDSLPGVLPGTRIKLATLIGLGEIDKTNQTRNIDSGGIAQRIWLKGGTTIVEPIQVRLAIDPELDSDKDRLSDDEEAELGTDPLNSDTDQDGLPDGWESFNDMDPISDENDSGAEADPDRDGFNNVQEYLAGTDPHDSRSRLAVHMIDHDTVLEIGWTAVPGKRYQLQARGRILDAFENLPEFALEARASAESFLIPKSAIGTRFHYYRILLVQ